MLSLESKSAGFTPLWVSKPKLSKAAGRRPRRCLKIYLTWFFYLWSTDSSSFVFISYWIRYLRWPWICHSDHWTCTSLPHCFCYWLQSSLAVLRRIVARSAGSCAEEYRTGPSAPAPCMASHLNANRRVDSGRNSVINTCPANQGTRNNSAILASRSCLLVVSHLKWWNRIAVCFPSDFISTFILIIVSIGINEIHLMQLAHVPRCINC